MTCSAMPSYASYSRWRTSRPRECARVVPMNVAIAPAPSSRTSATAASTESGSADSLKSPPETGGMTATSSPAAESLGALDVRPVARVQEPGGLVAERELRPDVAHGGALVELELELPAPACSRSAANSLTCTFTR